MKLTIKRGISNGAKFCNWQLGSYYASGNFMSESDYSALIGIHIEIIHTSSGKTKIGYTDRTSGLTYSNSFEWNRVVELHRLPIKEIKEKLELRKREILDWIENLDYEENLVTEIS